MWGGGVGRGGLRGQLALLAERLHVRGSAAALEDVVLRHLTIDNCSDALSRVAALAAATSNPGTATPAMADAGATGVVQAARALALSRLEELSRTDGFSGLPAAVRAALGAGAHERQSAACLPCTIRTVCTSAVRFPATYIFQG